MMSTLSLCFMGFIFGGTIGVFFLFYLYKVHFITNMRKRTNRVEIKLNDDELNHLNKLVKESNLSRESYLRMCINGLVHECLHSCDCADIVSMADGSPTYTEGTLWRVCECLGGIVD